MLSQKKSFDADKVQKEYRRKLEELAQQIGNRECCDCTTPRPTWASASLGIFICLRCAGLHRSLGTHISFVRSIQMDDWTPKQMENMFQIGNKRSTEYYEFNKPANVKKPSEFDSAELVKQYIHDKYVRRKYANKSEPSPAEQLEKQRVEEAKKKSKSSSSSRSSSAAQKKKQNKLSVDTNKDSVKVKVGKPVAEVDQRVERDSSDEEGNYDLSDSEDDDFKSSKSTAASSAAKSSLLSFNFDEGIETVSTVHHGEERQVNVNNHLISSEEKKAKKSTKKKKVSSKKKEKKPKKVKNGREQLDSDSGSSVSSAPSPYDFIFDEPATNSSKKVNVSELTDFLSEIGPEAISQKPLTIDEFEQQLMMNLQMDIFSKPSTPTTTATTSTEPVSILTPKKEALINNEGRSRSTSAGLVSLGDKVHEDRIVYVAEDHDSGSEDHDFSSDSEDEMFKSSKKKKAPVQKQALLGSEEEQEQVTPKKKKKKSSSSSATKSSSSSKKKSSSDQKKPKKKKDAKLL